MTADTFFKELNRIILLQPHQPTHSLNSENCEDGDQLYYCKDMINSFDTLKSADGIYVFDSMNSANCVDVDYSFESQLCYDSVSILKCFNCDFVDDCSNLRDSSYCYGCREGSNLFGCVNLTGKSYCIFNRQLTEEEYKEKIGKFKSLPREKILKMLEDLKLKYPITQTKGENNENSPYGHYVYNSKNCYMCFDSSENNDCAYMYDSGRSNNCMDATFSGDSELSYQLVDSGNMFNCNYAIWSAHCSDSSYIINSGNLKNCLGCVNLYQKEYCILNRQLTKEEYEVKSKQILEEIKKSGLSWDSIIS